MSFQVLIAVCNIIYQSVVMFATLFGFVPTDKLWLITLESSSARCVANLAGHSDSIWSVAFHPSAPLLASGSNDNTVKIWLLSPDNLSASCVANLTEQSCSVQTVAFHPTAPLLAASSENMTLKLWR